MAVSKKSAHRVIAYTASTESGGKTKSGKRAPPKYDALNPDDTGAGISFGFIQFNQGGGRLASKPGSPLAALLKKMNALAPAQFKETFGPYAAGLLDEKWVKANNLNTADIKARFVQSAKVPAFQEAQLEMAREGYWVPAERAAAKYGIKSERGHALLFDTSVQWGPARMAKFLDEAAQKSALHGLGATNESAILQEFALKADDGGKYNRRKEILSDPELSDASIVAIGGGAVVLSLVGLWAAWRYLR